MSEPTLPCPYCTCTCGAKALFAALAEFRATEEKEPT